METVDVRGLRIGFERTSWEPPVVLLHGGLSDHREWPAQRSIEAAAALTAAVREILRTSER